MKKINLKSYLVVILTVCTIALMSNIAFADNNTTSSIIIPTNTITSNTTTETTTTTNTTNTTNTTPVATTNTTKSVYNNTTSTLPKTGENDIYVVTALILVCGISAIYAYKKIRDYNNM